MRNREKTLRYLFGAALAAVTIATRFPIRSRTFFEFDSINFAVAAFRFDLGQVTPQVPGYILHVLFGRLLNIVTGDINVAYIWASILLSIGSVMCLWRAAAVLRGERVGVIAALLWLTMPLFWFHGAVNAIYAEEAFFTSALLYFGIKLFSLDKRTKQFVLCFFAVVIFYSLAGAARLSDLLFFLPAVLFVLWKIKAPKQILAYSILAFVIVTGLWLWELIRESGSIEAYWSALVFEGNFKTQSVLFGNTWASQFDTIGKVLFDFVVALGPTWLLVFTVDIAFARKSWEFIKTSSKNRKGQFVFLLAIVPLAFYLLVFFMKAGYLLNVLPSAILVRAVLLDQTAIWIAQRQKERRSDKNLLTRPLITRNALVLTGSIVILNILWFFVPWPGTEQRIYDNEDTRNSFIHGAVHRYEHSESRWLTLANRAFEYTNVSGIRAVDSLNGMTLAALLANHGNDSGAVILASWWYRWCYLLTPNATTYDIELDYYGQPKLWVGESHEMLRRQIADSIIFIHSRWPVLLLLRHDRPDFDSVACQVHLTRLPLPEYLDIYCIEDTAFTLRWGNRVFVSE